MRHTQSTRHEFRASCLMLSQHGTVRARDFATRTSKHGTIARHGYNPVQRKWFGRRLNKELWRKWLKRCIMQRLEGVRMSVLETETGSSRIQPDPGRRLAWDFRASDRVQARAAWTRPCVRLNQSENAPEQGRVRAGGGQQIERAGFRHLLHEISPMDRNPERDTDRSRVVRDRSPSLFVSDIQFRELADSCCVSTPTETGNPMRPINVL